MTCDEIASILNAHETDSLSPARRAAADAHLEMCAECAGAWQIAGRLRRERWPNAPDGLLATIAARFDGPDGLDARSRPAAEATRRAARRAAPGGLLAASVALAVGIAVWVGGNAPAPVSDIEVSNVEPSDIETSDVLEPGRDYRVVASPGAQVSGPLGGRDGVSLAGATPARVEVVQFFMYECFPCYAFEPQVDGWETKAEHVDLVRVPVVFNPTAELHARAFYTAEALDKLDEMHAALFAEIHERGNPLDTEASIAAFFAGFGVDEDTFRRTYRSREVDEKVAAAIELARSVGVTATPSLVVARRYLTSPSMTGSYEETFAVVDRLAESVREAARRTDRCRQYADELAFRRRLDEFRNALPEIPENRVGVAGGNEAAPQQSARSETSLREGSAADLEGPTTTRELVDTVSRGCGELPPLF